MCVFSRAYAGDPVCARGCVCVCARAHAVTVFARHRVRVRRARHVIERNPPPETRGSEGDSFAYKASANICPEQLQSWWKHQLGARHGNIWRIIFYFPLDLSLGNSRGRCKPGETHLRAALEVDVTPNASIILELSSDRRYSGWVQSFLGVIWCTYDKTNVSTYFILFFKGHIVCRESNLIRCVRNFILVLEMSVLNCTWTKSVIFPPLRELSVSARLLTMSLKNKKDSSA